jgi:transcriptional regulatory protein LevR
LAVVEAVPVVDLVAEEVVVGVDSVTGEAEVVAVEVPLEVEVVSVTEEVEEVVAVVLLEEGVLPVVDEVSVDCGRKGRL